MLAHWTEENKEIKFDKSVKGFSVFNQTSGTYQNYDMEKFQEKVMTNDGYEKYTGMSLQNYYLMFLVGIVVHYIIVTIITLASYKLHKKIFSFAIVNHVFSSIVLPEVKASNDWDEPENEAEAETMTNAQIQEMYQKVRNLK